MLRGEHRAALVLARTGPLAGLVVVGVALAAALLVPAGIWRPAVVWPVVIVVVALAWRLGRAVPARQGGVPVWSAALSVALSAAFTLWAALTHAEHVVLRRDPGAYALYTQWIATHHALPVADHLAAFGGAAAYSVPGFTLDSPAFYEVLHGAGPGTVADVVPQFLVGSPALFSLGWWTGALAGQPWVGVQVVPAIVGGFALMAFAGLTARLVGARWAPLAVAALSVSFPVLHSARSTYSEPAALLLVLVAACLVVDALAGLPGDEQDDDARRQRLLGVLAGAVLGLAGLVRVDAVREVAILMPCCALLAVRRYRAAVPLGVSALAGTALSMGVWLLMARPYLQTVSASLAPLLAATLLVTVVSVVAVPLARRRPPAPVQGDAGGLLARLPRLGTVAVLAAGVLLAARPLVTTVRQDPNDPGSLYVASLQRGLGLPIDGGRTYAEHSVEWIAWYTGYPALVAAWIVLAVVTGSAVRWWLDGPDRLRPSGLPASFVPGAFVPAAVGLVSTLLVLYRPGITPDHPWADRRLVPVVLPLVVLAATAAVAWAVRWARRRAAIGLYVLAAVVAVGGLLVPPAGETAPLATQRTEVGEPGAVAAVCATLRPGDVVATVDATASGIGQRSANEWVQVVRGPCGHPSAALLTPSAQLPVAVRRLAGLVAGAGGRLVLLTAQENDANALRVLATAAPGAPARRAVLLVTTEDGRLLTRAPNGAATLVIDVWTAAAPAGG